MFDAARSSYFDEDRRVFLHWCKTFHVPPNDDRAKSITAQECWELYYIDQIENYAASRELPSSAIPKITLEALEGRFSDFATALMLVAAEPRWQGRPHAELVAETERRMKQ